jgi:nucleotide-binding universal stress UspA family protein
MALAPELPPETKRGSPAAVMPAGFRRILVAVDFSDDSRAAVHTAAELAALFGGSLELLHVWQPPPLRPDLMVWAENDGTPLWQFGRAQAERELDQFVATLPLELRSELLSSVAEGDPARVILERAASGRYDLVAVGTHGRTGLDQLLVGSIAEKIVRAAACPVLTVRSAG